jgi:8-oxo-dGTP diphosphatase
MNETAFLQKLSERVFHDADQEVVEYDGSPVEWRVSAYVVIQRDDKVLIIKNLQEKLYDIVGGGIEFGETVVEALQREAMEEAGAVVKVGELLHAETDWFYHRGKKKFYQTMQLFYNAEVVGELQKPTDPDIDQVYWVSFSELENYPVPPTVAKVLRQFVEVITP